MAKTEQQLHDKLAALGMIQAEGEESVETTAGPATMVLNRLEEAAAGEGDIVVDEDEDETAVDTEDGETASESEPLTDAEQVLHERLGDILNLDIDAHEAEETTAGPATMVLNRLEEAAAGEGDIVVDEDEDESPQATEVEEAEADAEEEPLTDTEQALHDRLTDIFHLDEEADLEPEPVAETDTPVEARSGNKLRRLLGMLSRENLSRPVRAVRERLAQENGIPLPSRENLPFGTPDLSGLIDFLPSRDSVPSVRRIKRLFREGGRPEPTAEEIQNIQERVRRAAENTEETTSRFKELTAKMKDVPWQTMVLTSAKPIAKVAATSVLRSSGKDLAAIPLAQLLGASSMVNPVAAGIIAGVADSYRLATGGREKLYKSAAQDTWAGLTTWRGKERRGAESQSEFDKNRLKGKYLKGLSGLPLFALRKVGVAFNALRSTNTRLWMGITRDRSKISKELARIDDGAETLTNDALAQSILSKLESGSIQKDVLLKLDRPLARLRATKYGAIDVVGEKGKIGARVAERHTAERLQQLHEVLHQLVESGQIVLTEEEKKKWDSEYEDVERKTKDKGRKFAIIAGNALATFATVGAATWIPMLADKLEEFDLKEFKEKVLAQFESADDSELSASIEDTDVVEEPVTASATATATASPTPTATPSPTSTPSPTATLTPSPTLEAEAIDVDTAADTVADTELDSTEAVIDPDVQLDADTELQVENSPEAAEIAATTDVSETADSVATVDTTTTAPAQPESFGLGTNRVEVQPETTTDSTIEVPEEAPELDETSVPEETAELDDAIEITNLGEDEVPWNAIYYSIQNNPGVNVNNINGTTNVIKNLYKALNFDLPTGRILPDSGFAILPDAEIPTELPEGAVAYFFSEDQIENLAEEIDAAITLSKEGAELTDMQEALVQLNGGRLSFEDLAQDRELLEDILKIATER